ncbi:T-complex protein 1, eta subunit [Edhazardia aedis USNM 41457]|uniref:CCT-eta n=1 Tax=Edhazardia aedis (strain USNM 41457) TaxID=1003232 RepID=J9D867_EDHAE|nr:T-complex protein 1, eta subunit [Edhazardia aedis USNM 41457]|eukprot:EJW03699.1 T-complex protein 1, eta subunit [Edhazardia aedis USNM 41457]
MQIEEQIDNRQGKPQIFSNIQVLEELSSILETSLGPLGMDKFLISSKSQITTNDGATIVKNLGLEHPIAKLIQSVSVGQDEEAGDGTTSIILLTVEILKSLKDLLKRNDVTEIIDICDEILLKVLEILEENSLTFDESDRQEMLLEIAKTPLTSKILKNNKEYFATLVVKALQNNTELAIRPIKGGSFLDSFLFKGVIFEKCFTYAGYEQQPKKIDNAKILLTNVELEWKSERENAEVKLKSVEQYQKAVDAEWKIIRDKLDFARKCGANVVFSSSAIGDYATQYFAKYGIFCAGRVSDETIKNVIDFCGGRQLSSLNIDNMPQNKSFLARADFFEERQMGNLRYNFVASEKGSTIVLRGPGEDVLKEMERSMHDSITVVKKNMSADTALVTGGGSVEMLIGYSLKKHMKELQGKKIFVYQAVSDAFENFVAILAKNFGLDFLTILVNMREKIASGEKHFGIARNDDAIADMRLEGVFEPLNVKKNVFIGAFNAVKSILSIDSTVFLQNKR